MTKDVIASKSVQKSYGEKNKKFLNNTIQEDIYMNKTQKYPSTSKSSKSK